MECIVANVDHMRFDIEVALDEQYGALPLPFTGMDSKSDLDFQIFLGYAL
jgi:cleavage and polyadenylation specificity factor subunit 4